MSPKARSDEWGRDSTAVYVEVSYGVHTSGHGSAFACQTWWLNVNRGLQAHSSLLLLLSLAVYRGHKNRPQWVNLFAKCGSLLPETSTFISKEITEGIQVWARYENVALVITSTPILLHFTVNIHNLFTSPWLHTACLILQTPNELQVALVHEVNETKPEIQISKKAPGSCWKTLSIYMFQIQTICIAAASAM